MTQPDAPFLLAPEPGTTISLRGAARHRAGALRRARGAGRAARRSRLVHAAERRRGGERVPRRDVRRLRRLADQPARAGRARSSTTSRIRRRASSTRRRSSSSASRRSSRASAAARSFGRPRPTGCSFRGSPKRRPPASPDARDAGAADVHVGHDRHAERGAALAREPDPRRALGRARARA